jgi:hypothetical protein
MKFSTLLTLAAAALVSAEYSQSSKHVPGIQHVLENWNKSPLASYPTDFTRGIIPVCPIPSGVVDLHPISSRVSRPNG